MSDAMSLYAKASRIVRRSKYDKGEQAQEQ